MIEVYLVYEDQENEHDGDIVDTFMRWDDAIEYCDWYRAEYAVDMGQDEWGICAYHTTTGEYY